MAGACSDQAGRPPSLNLCLEIVPETCGVNVGHCLCYLIMPCSAREPSDNYHAWISVQRLSTAMHLEVAVPVLCFLVRG